MVVPSPTTYIEQPAGIRLAGSTTHREKAMEKRNRWKHGSRLDSVLNVLVIVLALGMLGLGAVQNSIDSAGLEAATLQA